MYRLTALRCLSVAVALRPNSPGAHISHGVVLAGLGRVDSAVAEFRQAIRLKPDDALAHSNLGLTLVNQGRQGEATAEYRQAIRLKPDDALAHYSLGNILRNQGELEEATVEYRHTIRLLPLHAEAHCGLGLVLGRMGLFREALESLERGHELGSQQADWQYPSDHWVRLARQRVDLEGKITAILKGEATPKDADERLALRDFCYTIGRHAAASQFADEAFGERPTLGDDLSKGYRYDAARSAALAGSGQGKDDPMPDESARARLRAKALAWLRADLTAWNRLFDDENEPARKRGVIEPLKIWKNDSDLAGIRDEAALAKLPEGEREGFRALWADVEALRKKAEGGK